MPYAVNTVKGTTIQNDDLGELPGLIAVPITSKQALIAKHLVNVIVFEKVAGMDDSKSFKGLYGSDRKTLEVRQQEAKTYTDFMKEYKDPSIAAKKWNEYKTKFGIKDKG